MTPPRRATQHWPLPAQPVAEHQVGSQASTIQQFVRYVAVGGAGFVADFSILTLATEQLHWHYLASAAVAFTAGLTLVYLLSICWVFDRRRLVNNKALEFQLFALVGLVGLGLNHILLWGFTERAGLHYLNSKLLAAGIILLWNFGARKWLLFR